MAKKDGKGQKNRRGNEKPGEPMHMSGKEVEERLLEAGSEEELRTIHKVLRAEGVPDGTITATITKLRKRGSLIFQTALTERGEGTKPLPVEAIIKELKLPKIADGDAIVFDAGVSYGMRAMVAGIRMAQELSQMGIAQASPVIRMAKELREGAGESAQEAGQRAAEDALAGAIQYMSQQKADIATVPNPMMGIMARAMEPALTQAMGRMFGAFGGQPVQQGQQLQQGTALPPGWSEKPSEEQAKE